MKGRIRQSRSRFNPLDRCPTAARNDALRWKGYFATALPAKAELGLVRVWSGSASTALVEYRALAALLFRNAPHCRKPPRYAEYARWCGRGGSQELLLPNCGQRSRRIRLSRFSGFVVGAKRPTIAPARSARNLVKFHLMRPIPRMPRFCVVRNR